MAKKLVTPKSERLLLSQLEAKDSYDLLITLQSKSIDRMETFFIRANVLMLSAILLFALLEHKNGTAVEARVITDKVVIAAVAGVAIQSGAILIAAFKGFFAK